MNQAPRCPAGDVCLPPANTSSQDSLLIVRVRAAVRYAARTLGLRATPDEIDDLSQEVLLRLWQRYPSRWGRYSRQLVNRVAVRLAIDEVRYATAKKRDIRRTASLEQAGHVSLCATPLDEALSAREELNDRLSNCRRTLPPEEWRLFIALHVYGVTSREAAALFGSSSVSLDTRSLRIRRRLTRHGIELRRRASGGAS